MSDRKPDPLFPNLDAHILRAHADAERAAAIAEAAVNGIVAALKAVDRMAGYMSRWWKRGTRAKLHTQDAFADR